ncbi:MAG TPA: hypothetical protein VGJ14_13850 [Sporichthyaceae bacterium]|jgi:hypothetical protein
MRRSEDPDQLPPPITLRCTGNVLKLLRIPPAQLHSAPAAAQDWYANLLWLDRRKCLLVTHAATLFSVFLPDVRAAGLRPIGAAVVPAVRTALAAEALPADTFGPLNAVTLAKTADRQVLAVMRDLAVLCQAAVADAGGLARVDLAGLHHAVQRNPSRARGYETAIDLVRRQLGEP